MSWINNIFSFVWSISDIFLNAYFIVSGWWAPFNALATPLLWLHQVFWSLLTPIAQFHDWAVDVWSKVLEILDAEGILGLIGYWFPALGETINWFYDRWSWFQTEISNWWGTVSLTIHGWIDIAVQGVQSLIDNVATGLATLQSSWNDFWTITYPTLATWAGTSALIDSALRSWFPFYDDLVALWESIAEFFTDPPQYVYNKLDEWFERFW